MHTEITDEQNIFYFHALKRINLLNGCGGLGLSNHVINLYLLEKNK